MDLLRGCPWALLGSCFPWFSVLFLLIGCLLIGFCSGFNVACVSRVRQVPICKASSPRAPACWVAPPFGGISALHRHFQKGSHGHVSSGQLGPRKAIAMGSAGLVKVQPLTVCRKCINYIPLCKCDEDLGTCFLNY